jgi:23S rRNA (cytidine2498-2'-O)-methyltransferase
VVHRLLPVQFELYNFDWQMSQDASQFVFMTCRPGAETALKQEVACAEPAWRPSFSRPGFLTFKHSGEKAIDVRRLAERNWTFAHSHGISLGRLDGTQLNELKRKFWEQPYIAALVQSGTKFDIHTWQREPTAVDDRGMETALTPLCQEIDSSLRAAKPARAQVAASPIYHRKPSPRNSRVVDVVVVEPNEWWIGHHLAVQVAERWPGGEIPIRLPAHAVSRAYAKLEEALRWSNLPVAAGDECVEIGCAPGGASQALLDRGLFVTGIDPADVDPIVLEHPRFRHLKKRGADVRRHEFEGVRWLVADMNIGPQAALDEIETIVRHPQIAIRGMVLTLKFSDWSLVSELPNFISRVHGWGYRDVRVRQLVTGGQEVCLVALKRKALRRLGKKRKAVRGRLRIDSSAPGSAGGFE